jgi:myosin I
MAYFTDKELDQYPGCSAYENPPHIYALTDFAYRNMLIDSENQCVIISGESGAGKTVSAKYIMNYITKVTGGGDEIQRVKRVILESNPLLEAFGNAKTARNNNSSRFGKYCEIQFSRAGQPDGGRITNFLLEKSRVCSQNPDERSFHIFYQLCAGATAEEKEKLGVDQPSYFNYLSGSGCYTVDGTDDKQDWQDTLNAMGVMGIDGEDKDSTLRMVAAVMHIGNIDFVEEGAYAKVRDPSFLQYPAFLLGIDAANLEEKLLTHLMESRWGGKVETTTVTHTLEQAQYTRDALAKAIYTRQFDYLVKQINTAFTKETDELAIGVLDIYGFEIFERNGFEQFCINYVNEKLQQIFIELTLKAEQEEYVSEGITWTPVEFFNNKVVCDLIEAKAPIGILIVLDDVCATLHASSDGADAKLATKLGESCGGHEHFKAITTAFTIQHYAGHVTYEVDGFCERNRDAISTDLLKLVQSTTDPFLSALFPEDPEQVDKHGRKKKQATAGGKIRTQANLLVDTLMKTTPHYIRCIKPNETKKPKDWEDDRCKHQVVYLGLKENVRVRRAGFAFRRVFHKFLQRYAILTPETFPKWNGDARAGVMHLLDSVMMDSDQYQLGNTKIFVKNPESLFLLEEVRERKYDGYARKIQSTYRRWKAQQYFEELKVKASDILQKKKERRRGTINRNYMGDYMGFSDNPVLRSIVGKKARVEFAYSVKKYDRRWRDQKRDLLLTTKDIYIIGREKEPSGPNKGQMVEVVKRKIPIGDVGRISLSTKQDGFIVLHMPSEYDTVLDCVFKTEFLTLLDANYKTLTGNTLQIDVSDSIQFTVKKSGWGGGATQTLEFKHGTAWDIKPSSRKLLITVPVGMPATTAPTPKAVMKSSGGASRAAAAPRTAAPLAAPSSRPIHAAPPPGRAAPAPQFAPPAPVVHAAPAAPRVVPPSATAAARRGPAVVGGGPTASPTPGRRAPGPPAPTAPVPRAKPPPAPKPSLPKARAIYDYEAADVDELVLKVGDIVMITKKDPSGWWQGKKAGKEGLFPGNYVEML